MKTILAFFKWIWKYNEWWIYLPLFAGIFWLATKVLADERFTVYDLGIVQKVFIGLAFFVFIIGLARIGQIIQHPKLSRYNDEDCKKNKAWEALTERDKAILSHVSYLVYVVVLAILIAGV